MPCNCDYMDPTDDEKNSKEVAGHLLWLIETYPTKINTKYTKEQLGQWCKNFYGNRAELNNMVVELCRIIKGFDVDTINDVVYDGRSKRSRQLADWWDTHKAADAARDGNEISPKDKEIVKSVIDELTPTQLLYLISQFAQK